jgi:hypothetical protein
MPVFGNPLGLLALLGIPAVLAIHYLQRKARELPVSTLFLLDRTQREAAGGRVFERLLPSVPLWMQLLAVLALAWFLAEPRFRKGGSVQRVAVVLDSSASMEVFKDAVVGRLVEVMPEIQGTAAGVQLTVLESAPGRPRLYAGDSVDGLRAALEAWLPRDGPVDPTSALRLARSLVSREGTVVYLTDTPAGRLPFDALPLPVGQPIGNVGFTGVSFGFEQGVPVWRALVKNHGAEPAERTWRMESAGGAGAERPLRLDPGALVTLQGAFPAGGEDVRVVLSGDAFALDDVLPLVVPVPKTLRIFHQAGTSVEGLAMKLRKSLDAVEAAAVIEDADLAVVTVDPAAPAFPPGDALVLLGGGAEGGEPAKGEILVEPHAFTDGLNWQALRPGGSLQLEAAADDKVLLWLGKRPLVFLRESAGGRQLVFNFDPARSNAESLPAFIVLLHRFAESLREAKVAPVAANLETGQIYQISANPGLPLEVRATDLAGDPVDGVMQAGMRVVMKDPGFLQVRQGEDLLLNAAVHFGDPREADFSACGAAVLEDETAERGAAVDRHTRPDPWWRLWLLVLLLALLVSWKFTAQARIA